MHPMTLAFMSLCLAPGCGKALFLPCRRVHWNQKSMDNLLPQQNTLQKFVMQPKKEIKLFCERLIYFSTRQKRICVFTDSKKV